MALSPEAVADLAKSGLDPDDIKARAISQAELTATKAPVNDAAAYVIPYHKLNGDPLPYYRVRFMQPMDGNKYRGPAGVSNQVYFPRGLAQLLANPDNDYLLVVEGEKKAACAVKNGMPAVGLAGVDSWRNRIMVFAENTELKPRGKGWIQAKIPSGDSNDHVRMETGNLAEGMELVIDLAVKRNMHIIICFDTDKEGVKPAVQRAASQLGYELRFRGVPFDRIRQYILSPLRRGKKIALDDAVVVRGAAQVKQQIRNVINKPQAFPQHPNPVSHIAGKLQRGSLSRKDAQETALTILMELEARGKRLVNKETQEVFYFDQRSHTLMPAVLGDPRVPLHTTAFGSYLYRKFNLSASDTRIVQWLATQYHGESGIEHTTTQKILAFPNDMADCIAIQISDSHFVIVTPDPNRPYIICENGTHGVLFEQGQVENITHQQMERVLVEWEDAPREKMLWKEVVSKFNFQMPESGSEINLEQTRLLAALLYYLSPWLLKWRNMQLPVELTIGEPGSGKSSMYELRQMILSGVPHLSNLTNDIKDWYAGITARGGLYVMDNVHFTGSSRDYRQRLSDELCRLVTEPRPHVELRKLYTTSDILSMPVRCTFALTALEMPFPNIDLIQRAAIFELSPIRTAHNANWVKEQLELANNRVGWLAHHIITIHRFLRAAIWEGRWDSEYRANNRLAHYEQGLMLMASVFGIDNEWIPDALSYKTDTKSAEADMVFNALEKWVEHLESLHEGKLYEQRFGVSEVSEWASEQPQIQRVRGVTNSRSLAKYVKNHITELQKNLGIYPDGTHNNRAMYRIGNPDGT